MSFDVYESYDRLQRPVSPALMYFNDNFDNESCASVSKKRMTTVNKECKIKGSSNRQPHRACERDDLQLTN